MGAEVERRACVTTNTLVAPAFAPPDDDRFLPPTTTSINPVQFQFSIPFSFNFQPCDPAMDVFNAKEPPQGR